MDALFSDYDSFSESSSSEDQDDTFSYGGQASCILSNMEETISKINDFLLFERKYVHGDIVSSTEDPSTQIGRVINVDMLVDLENVHQSKVNNVNSRKLQKVCSVSIGDYVVSGPWVGKVEKIVERVTVLFDDGTKSEFTTTGMEKLIPLSPDLFEDSQYLYYPGQRVQVEISSSKSARWLCGALKEREDQGTVCAVDAGLVCVDWFGCALFDHEKLAPPSSMQTPNDLTLLSCSSSSNWQLGDLCVLPLNNHKDVREDMCLKHSGKVLQTQQNINPCFQEIFVIAKTKTKVDVLWQDGSQSLGLNTQFIFPVNIVDAHDFLPGQFVLEKEVSNERDIPKWGVVKYVDPKERMVRVSWKSSEENHKSNVEGKQMEETVSAYELVEHPDYMFCHGDVVLKLEKGHVDKTSIANEGAQRKWKGFNDEHNIYLSQIGIVEGFKDGIVDVKWANGFTTKVAPNEIFRVDKSESLSVTPETHDESNAPNEDKTEQNHHNSKPNEKNLLDSDDDVKDCLKSVYDSSYLTLPQAAFGFFNGIATGLLGSLGYSSLLGASSHVSEDGPVIHPEEEVLELSELCPTSPPTIGGDFQASVKTNMKEVLEETQKNKGLPFPSSGKNMKQVNRFDMVNDCLDNHFVDGAGKGLPSSQVKRVWMKKVQHEWSILEKDLPETIFVRAYEERMDLLRAAIVGAPGTPYHDNLFFFDIFLPPTYPHEPPMVHYHSGGLRVNPNLYESGKVCLSLLNTWTGAGSEVWNPDGSTILQILLSLQALVLNEKPYFNEAGYDKQIGRAEGEKNSVSYNENVYIVSCKSMIYLLRKPPKHFEELVEEHFRERCEHILKACKVYQEGVPVGCAFGKEKNEQDQKGCSTGFKIALAKLFPKLVEAFSEKGIDCSTYI